MKQVTLHIAFTMTNEELEEGNCTILQQALAKLSEGDWTTVIKDLDEDIPI